MAEWGSDRGHFGTADRLSAWSGVAPGNDERAGKRRSGKTRNGNRAPRTGLTQVAHAIVVTAFHRLSRHQPYHQLGANDFDAQRREHLLDPLTRRIEQLGYRVSLELVPPV
jgi:transposase